MQEKIDFLQAKLRKFKDIDDEFYREVNKAYKEKLKPLYLKKVGFENSINTATSVNDYLYQFKKVLSPYGRTISSLTGFALNKVFSRESYTIGITSLLFLEKLVIFPPSLLWMMTS